MEEIKIDNLPADWTIESLVDIVETIDYGVSQAIPKVQTIEGVKIVSTADINRQGQLLYQKIRRINVPKKTIERITLKDGDVLFNWRNSLDLIGKTAVFHEQDEPHIFASFILRIRCDEEITHNYFLKYLLNYYRENNVFVQLARRAVNQANYNKNEIGVLKVPFPKVKEQRKIAYVLNNLRKAIEQQDKLIKTTTELKEALMQKLFTEGTKGEKQKQTEIGLVPESWEIMTIGQLGKCITGTTPKTAVEEYWNKSDYDFIAPADIGNTKYVYDSEKKISTEGLNVSRVLPKDSVMCVCIGSSIGKVGLTYKDNSATNQQINSIVSNELFNPIFVYYMMVQHSDHWRSHSTFGPVPILNKSQFEKIKIAVTRDLQEQNEIANSLSTLDTKIEFHQKKRQILNDLFKTLLHELMTGQRRVHEVEFKTLTKEYTIEQEPLSMVADKS
jgi:type I restriction enzyme S subunit